MTMDAKLRRRRFLQSASAIGLGAGLSGTAALRVVTPARAEEMVVTPEAVRLRPEIEPVVRWMEDTPRERVFEVAVEQLKNGLSYRDLMAGLFLAGVRNVQPRPVGFKFHAVLVINSAHLLGQSAAVDDRLLPMFWALDNFKNSQAQDVKEGDWTLSKVDESHVPGPGEAKAAFVKAMEEWDADAADTAVAGLCRSAGAAEAMEPFWRYGVRDHRDIGHKAIFAAQCWRTLQAIGWANAEPVLRSLAYGLLDMRGNATKGPVGPYDVNLENAKRIKDGWQAGRADLGATQALLDALRHASPEEASAEIVKQLNSGVSADSLWDGVVLGANELLLRNPTLIPLHAVTAANALHFIYGASGDNTTRKLALLQAAGWIPLYRGAQRPNSELKIDALTPVVPDSSGDEAVGEMFLTAGKNRNEAAARAVGYLEKGGSAELIFAAARRMIFHKGRDSHDYKYGAAAWEEVRLASDPKWQAPLIAAAMAKFPSADTPDSPLMNRAREAVSRVLGRVG
jgi:hypothetical protein